MDSQRKWKYGMETGDYDRMLNEQGGTCYICKNPPNKDSLDVDHCHKTGKVRKLLCNRCNKVLGMMEENPELLIQMTKYVEENCL